MTLRIEARRWIAVWYRCPVCGAQSGEMLLTPWRWAHRVPRHHHSYKCNDAELEVVEHKWYTTFCIESGLGPTTVAGTLAEIGPFRVCQIVHPNIRKFRAWYRRRKAEEAEKTRQYLERERQIETEWRARRQRQAVAVGGPSNFDPFLDLS